MTPRDATAAIVQFTAQYTGLTVIWGFPNTPAPARPYVALLPIPGVAAVGHDEEHFDSVAETVVSMGVREFTVEVQFVQKPLSGADIDAGKNTAIVLAQMFRDLLTRPDVREAAQDLGISIQNTSPVLDVSALVGDEFEDRASFEIQFGYVTISPAGSVPRIDTVEIEPTIDGTVQDTITVST